MLPDMCEVSLDWDLRLMHIVDVFNLESRPYIKVALIDVSLPRVLYWYEHRRIYILDRFFLVVDLMYVIALVCCSVKVLGGYST